MDKQQAILTARLLLERKGIKSFSDVQEYVFSECWDNLPYHEIAERSDYEYNYVKRIGSQVWSLLSKCLDKKVSKSNFHTALQQYLIEAEKERAFDSGKNHNIAAVKAELTHDRIDRKIKKIEQIQDWEEVIDTTSFLGRETEIDLLQDWIVGDRVRLITILGMGGIGKTSLTAKLTERVGSEFQQVIWRSLRHAPPCNEFLEQLILTVSGQQANKIELSIPNKISCLLGYLRSQRCLLVLDNAESILESQKPLGKYQQGYEGYGELLRRIAEEAHQSCVVITSREQLGGIASKVEAKGVVRSLALAGLSINAAREVLRNKEVADSQSLVEQYAGNPLALKIAATTIKSIFAGDVGEFLVQDTFVYGDIGDLLAQQFARLSQLEQTVMYWLAINREWTTIAEIREDIYPAVTFSKLIAAIESLKGRSLIETSISGCTQQPVVMEYMTELIISQIEAEIGDRHLDWLHNFCPMKAQTKEYLRNAQVKLILTPTIARLTEQFGNRQKLIDSILQLIDSIRTQSQQQQGYSGGNLINILVSLDFDFNGCNLSRMNLWQAYLANIKLHGVNLADTDIYKSVFAQAFGAITTISSCPTGDRLATADTNGTIQIWNFQTNQLISAFRGYAIWVWSVAFSPDGARLASVADDDIVRLWDANTGESLQEFRGHTASIVKVVFNSQGDLIASCGQDETIRLWSVASTPSTFNYPVLRGHRQRIWSVVFHPQDRQILASGGEDATIKIWNLATGECQTTLTGHQHWVKCLAFSSDGQLLVSGSTDRTIKIWNLATGECQTTLTGHMDGVSEIAFSHDGTKLVSSSFDRTVRLWDVTSRKCLKVLQGHSKRLWSVDFIDSDRLIVSGGDDQTIKLWNTQTGQCVRSLQGSTNSVLAVAAKANSEYFVSGHEDRKVRLWSIKTGEATATLTGHANRIWCVALANRSNLILASGSADNNVKLWNAMTGECLKTLSGHDSWVWSLDFSPLDDLLASSSYDRTIRIWDVNTGNCLQTLSGHQARIGCIKFSADGRQLYSSSYDRSIKVWDISTGNCLHTLSGHTNNVWSVVPSMKENILVSSSGDSTIKLWDLTTGKCLHTLKEHLGEVTSLAFSTDGKYLISGGYDRTIKIWDFASQTCLKTLSGHRGAIMSLTVSDRYIISGGYDETCKIWDLVTGKCLKTCIVSRLYEGMNIQGITGLTTAQKTTLKSLGSLETQLSI